MRSNGKCHFSFVRIKELRNEQKQQNNQKNIITFYHI